MMKGSLGCAMATFERKKPHTAMVVAQLIFAGMTLLSKAAISQGMNPYVFVVYRQAFATLALAPFAYFLESNKAAPLSCTILVKIFLASFLGMTLSFDLYCVAIHYTTATLAAAINTTVPTITFVLAVLLRLESISIKQYPGIAKVLGSIVSVSGAFVYIFVKGPPINVMKWFPTNKKEIPSPFMHYGSNGDWVKGSLIMLFSNATWSLLLIMQVPLIKLYPSKLRLVILQCFFSCIQSAIWAMVMKTKLSSWKLGWDLNLFSVAYCGVIVNGFSFWLRVWTIEKKGPVFAAMFTPLSLIFTAIFSAFLWKEMLHLGSVCGAIFLVGGLYSYLWGKSKEIPETKTNAQQSEIKEETSPEGIKI